MQLSATDSQGLIQDIDFLCGTNSSTYAFKDKVRNINQAYHEVSRVIREVEDGWQYDDLNKTDHPIGYTNLSDGVQDYTLPDGAQGVERAEVKDSNGDFQKLIQKDWHDIEVALSEYYETDGLPRYYDLVGGSIFLYPAPASGYVTTASGLKVCFSRDITEFSTSTAASAVTASPGFAKPFHRILSLDAAIMFEQDPTNSAKFIKMKNSLIRSLRKFYSHRNVERTTQIRPKNKRYWRQYE